MKFVKTFFKALVLVMFGASIVMVVTHAKADLDDIESAIDSIKEYTINSTDDTQEEMIDNNSVENLDSDTTSSCKYTMPYTVIDDDLLSNNTTYSSQSPDVGPEMTDEQMQYIDTQLIVQTTEIDYENVLGLSYMTIYSRMYEENLSIWQIATEIDKNSLLENVYCGYYTEMIIQMVNNEDITQDMADRLIEYVIDRLGMRVCPSIDQMLVLVNGD